MVADPPTCLVAEVAIDAKSAGARAVYSYLCDEGVRPGNAHFVPLGPRRAIGFVLSVGRVDERSLGFSFARLKALGPVVEGLSLPEATLDLVSEVSRQTLTPLPVALSLAVPAGVRERLVTKWRLTDDPGGTSELTSAQREALAVLRESGELIDSKARPLPESSKRTLRALERKGLACQTVALSAQAERHRLEGTFRLNPDPEVVEEFLNGPAKRRPAQAVTVMRLQGSESASFTAQEIKSLGSVTDQTVRSLVQAGLLVPSDTESRSGAPGHVPNERQSAAIRAIVEAAREDAPKEFLLFGVTGSGKTEVYLRAAAEVLKFGRQVLYLVPEIALTAQVIAQLRQRFGPLVAVMHSGLGASERLDNWLKVRTGQSPIVLGPRSAVFAPFYHLGLVILDEEHEGSYKQESSPRYQTKSLVRFLGERFRCPVVYGSATPSIEAFHAAQTGSTCLLRLPERAAAAKLPEVSVVDLAELYRQRRPSLISPELEAELRAALERGEQAIVFLNRRAYSPFLICRDCGHRFACPHCTVSLALHRKEARLRCHQCGHQEPVADVCPDCRGVRVAPFGAGTEKVEEALQALFPDLRVARLDRDVARRKGAIEETLASFRSRETQVLVGTQMVAKGLDFPNVTVVGVVAADVSLNVPDFRASERTFQLLSQVAGRAGRGRSPGKVVIQTFNPTNEAIVQAKTHGYESFFSHELQVRREAGYPPFKRLVDIVVTGANRQDVHGVSAVAAQRLRLRLEGAEVLGPANCAIERLQGLWRRHVLVKLAPGTDPSPVRSALEGLERPTVKLMIDVDPASSS